MKKKYIKIIPLFLGLLFIAIRGIRTISNPEFWTHLSHGKLGDLPLSYIQNEQSVNVSYLYDILLQSFFSLGGPSLVILLNVVGLVLAFYLFSKASSKLGSIESVSIGLIFSGIILFRVIDVIPSTIMILMIALYFNILQKNDKTLKDIIILSISQILWVNLHSSFIIGLFLVLLFLIEYIFQSKRSNLKKEIIIVITVFASSLVNPNLLNTHEQILNNLQNYFPIFYSSSIYNYYSPPSIKPILILLSIISGFGLITSKKKLPLAITISAILGFFLIYTNPIHTFLFISLSFPFLIIGVESIKNIFVSFYKSIQREDNIITNYGFLILMFIICISLTIPVINSNKYKQSGNSSVFGLGISKCFITDELPKEIQSSIIESDAKLVNLPIDGGWINYHFKKQNYIDYRKGLYNKEDINDLYDALNTGGDSLNKFITQHNPNIFILNLSDNFGAKGVISLLKNNWSIKYFDGITAILVPSSSELIQNYLSNGLNKLEGYKNNFVNNKIKGNPIPMIGASEAYLNLALANINVEKSAETAEFILKKIIENDNNILGAKIKKGYAQLILNKSEEAEKTFKDILNYTDVREAWIGYKFACEATGNKQGLKAADNFLDDTVDEIETIETIKSVESTPILERVIE